MNLHLEEPGTEYENLFAVIRQYQSENRAAEEKIQHLREQQEEEEFARQQALQEKEEADRLARQQAQEAREATRQQAQAEKEAARMQVQAEMEAREAAPSEGTGICPSTGIKKTAGNAGPGRC